MADTEDRRTDQCWDGWHYPDGCQESSSICSCSCHLRRSLYIGYSTNDEGLCTALTIAAQAMYALADAVDRGNGQARRPQA